MRLKHRLMPVLGFGFLLALVSNVRAQSGVHPADRLFQSHGEAVVEPLTSKIGNDSDVVIRANNGFPYEEPVPGMPPGYAPVNSHPPGVAGVPPASQPWPAISPYENRYSEHSYENGLWMHNLNNTPRQYFAGLYGVLFDAKNPERQVFGDPASVIVSGNPALTIGGRSKTGGDYTFQDYFHSEGARVQWGFMDPDDTGLELVGWWMSDTHNGYHNATPLDINSMGSAATLTFSQLYHLVYRQVGFNLQATRLMRTIWEPIDAFKIRPVWGGRYLFFREKLSLDGLTDTFGGELRNKTSTHLFGPSAGLQGTIGGDLFKIILGGQFLLLANWDRQKLDGFNLIPDNSAPSTIFPFRDHRQQLHISPAFEITCHLEADLIDFIPLVNRLWFLQNAKIRGGVTYLTVGEIARPGKTTNFNAFSPSLNTRRSNFDLFAYDFGLIVTY